MEATCSFGIEELRWPLLRLGGVVVGRNADEFWEAGRPRTIDTSVGASVATDAEHIWSHRVRIAGPRSLRPIEDHCILTWCRWAGVCGNVVFVSAVGEATPNALKGP
eukprot:Polyplicarium_translucidae@DN2832_c2_g1_i1.p3